MEEKLTNHKTETTLIKDGLMKEPKHSFFGVCPFCGGSDLEEIEQITKQDLNHDFRMSCCDCNGEFIVYTYLFWRGV